MKVERGRDWDTGKGSTLLYLEYGHTFSNNIFGHNSRIWSEGPAVEIRLDLNPNLRGRSKETGTFLDARELADGGIAQLKLVDITDQRLFEQLGRLLKSLEDRPLSWWLTLELEGDRRFEVLPEVQGDGVGQSLVLRVVGDSIGGASA